MLSIIQLFHQLAILIKPECGIINLRTLCLNHSVYAQSSLFAKLRTIPLGTSLGTNKSHLYDLLNKPSDSLNKLPRPLKSYLNSDKDWLFYKCTNLENNRMECGRELTERELEILSLVSNEYSSDQIADQLILSKHTIISHRKKLLIKMGAKNTAGMIRKGFELGYLSKTKRP